MKKLLPVLMLVTMATACSGSPPASIGIHDGTLSPCPSRPNCVSSLNADEAHYVAPLHFTGSVEETQALLTMVINDMPGGHVAVTEGKYMRAEFTSKLFKYVDDVEFLFDPVSSTIQMRSASRMGYSDMGVNRKRLVELRRSFNEEQGSGLKNG